MRRTSLLGVSLEEVGPVGGMFVLIGWLGRRCG